MKPAWALCLVAASASAQGPSESGPGRAPAPAAEPPAAVPRPAEDELFGAAPPAPAAPSGPARVSEEAMFAEAAAPAQKTSQAPPEDPLKIGGMFYLRAEGRAPEGVAVAETRLSMPILMDAYFDARPNDRVRGMMVGRLRLDPVADPDEFAALGIHRDVGPKVLLDQLWLRFDVLRVAFITVGQQHIKWGSNRFWNPTDFLNPVLLDPLAVFDVRTGVTMLKVHVPWEAKGWNFYAFGLLDNYDRASNLGRVGGAVRAEIVFGTAEVALSAVASPGFNPRFGADLSAGFGAIDFTVEAAVRDAGDEMRYRPAANPDPTAGQAGLFERYSASGIAPQVTLGFSRSILYSDQDSFAIGAEYFYNSLGYKGPADYVALLINGAFRPFYVGEHYAAVYLFVPNPGSWNDTTFVLSTLANLSDVSLVSRLDVLVTVLTHLRFEAYVAGHYGTRGGEFRLGAQIEPGSLCPTCAGVNFPPPLVEVGAALRMNL